MSALFLKLRGDKKFTLANFGHSISKSWLRPCPQLLLRYYLSDLYTGSLQHNHWPCCKLQVNSAKTAMGQAEQDPDLPRSASNVLGKVQSHLCLTEWWGKLKCQRGESTLGAALLVQKIMFCNLCCTLTGYKVIIS